MIVGLISLMFPRAPILDAVRHPLDVMLSVFSNHLTHGFFCAYELTSIARHFALESDPVEHYRRELPLRYLSVRYEDVRAAGVTPVGVRTREHRSTAAEMDMSQTAEGGGRRGPTRPRYRRKHRSIAR